MKKTLLVVMLSVFYGSITNAQIKVVGDEYSTTMTGSKEYYDKDVDFDKIFPKGECPGYLCPTFPYDKEAFINRLGDTLYIYSPIPEQTTIYNGWNESFVFVFNNGVRIKGVPTGYYTIEGYVFCNDNADSIAKSMGLNLKLAYNQNEYNEKTILSLKQDILRKQEKFKAEDLFDYLVFYILKSTTDSIVVFATHDLLKSNSLKFYNEATKFIGKDVVWTFIPCGYFNPPILTAPFKGEKYGGDENNIVYDALTRTMIRLVDSKYKVDDIILKNGVFYAIISGTTTGTFAMEIKCIEYAYSTQDPDITETDCWLDGPSVNENGDIPYLVLKCPGNKEKDCPDDYRGNDRFIFESGKIAIMERRGKLSKAQQEQERKNKELQQNRAKKQQEANFFSQMIAKYGEKYGHFVGKKQVAVGMTKEMCKDAWGTPINTYRTTTSYGQSEVWCYNYKTRVYFYNGKVVQIDD